MICFLLFLKRLCPPNVALHAQQFPAVGHYYYYRSKHFNEANSVASEQTKKTLLDLVVIIKLNQIHLNACFTKSDKDCTKGVPEIPSKLLSLIKTTFPFKELNLRFSIVHKSSFENFPH